MRHFGYPEKVVRILENAYKDTFSAVRVDGELSDWFNTVVGVLQGCVLSPLLFNIFLEVIMAIALEDCETGAVINGYIIGNLRFADDIAMLAEKEEDLQGSVTRILNASQRMGMRINAEKTETQSLGKATGQLSIQIDSYKLKQTDAFVYLGGTISRDGSESDVKRRIGLARGLFQSLNNIWIAKELSRETKVQVYETLVLGVLLYNSETWTLKVEQKNRLRVLEMTFLRKIEGVTRRDRIRNVDIYARLNYHRNINDRIRERRLRYFGHICRMGRERYPKIVLNGHVHGQRSRGRPKKRWLDVVKEDCEEMGINIHEATRGAMDRERWRTMLIEQPMRAQASPRL